jgi:hypothetical protein
MKMEGAALSGSGDVGCGRAIGCQVSGAASAMWTIVACTIVWGAE